MYTNHCHDVELVRIRVPFDRRGGTFDLFGRQTGSIADGNVAKFYLKFGIISRRKVYYGGTFKKLRGDGAD